MDVVGVLILSLFLGGLAWVFLSAGFLHRRGGWVIVGLLFLIGFVWRFFIRAQITTESTCEHAPGAAA